MASSGERLTEHGPLDVSTMRRWLSTLGLVGLEVASSYVIGESDLSNCWNITNSRPVYSSALR